MAQGKIRDTEKCTYMHVPTRMVQATSDPGKEEKEKKETRVLSWTDCNNEEAKENEAEVKEEKETEQREDDG